MNRHDEIHRLLPDNEIFIPFGNRLLYHAYMLNDQRKTINDQPAKVIFRLGSILLFGLLLSSCSTFHQASERTRSVIDDAALTASGRIMEVKLRGEAAIQPVVDTVNEVNRRVDDLQKGIEKAKEAKESFDRAIGD